MGRRPLWADFLIAALAWWVVLLPLEFGGAASLVIASIAAGAVLVALLGTRGWRAWRSQ